MVKNLYVGIDGGATKSIIRLEDESGTLLGREISGPANIRISVEQTWHAINAGINKLKGTLGLSFDRTLYRWHAGIGVAGCELREAYLAFIHHPHFFTSLKVVSDAHTACLGAHLGKDGAIIIAGTGAVGYQIEKSHIAKVGGWGFPLDDEGSGAWLSFQALNCTMRAFDGRLPACDLTKRFFAHFHHDINQIIAWAQHAKSTDFAILTPLVIKSAQNGDKTAIELLKRAGKAMDNISDALIAQQISHKNPLPCSLIGGVAAFLHEYFGPKLTARLKPPLAPPDKGAIFLIHQTENIYHE